MALGALGLLGRGAHFFASWSKRSTIRLIRASLGQKVTGRLLPRRLGLDAGDEIGVMDEVVEELMPSFGSDARSHEHFSEFFDAAVSESRNGFFRTGVDADDVAVGQIVVVGDDGFQQLGVLAEDLRDIVYGADMGEGRHQAASARATATGVQFHGRSSSSRLIL